MVAPRYRSRKKAKIYTKAPGGNIKVHYKKRKPSKARCANCHRLLKGVPNLLPSRYRNLAKSSKTPKRKFAGNLCSSCARREIVQRARLKFGNYVGGQNV